MSQTLREQDIPKLQEEVGCFMHMMEEKYFLSSFAVAIGYPTDKGVHTLAHYTGSRPEALGCLMDAQDAVRKNATANGDPL